jgi:cellulose synthase/poly-beta-1,6-N-acetylglucosamine synthase-like glycosyltransferase
MKINNVKKGGLREKNIFKPNSNDNPLITIITVVLNNDKYLNECLDSLHVQNYSNYEHIIIDGGSTDRTIDILKKIMIKLIFGLVKKIMVSMMLLIKE